MDISKLSDKCAKALSIKNLAPNKWEIVTDYKFLNGEKICLFIKQEASKCFLCDNKCTIKYLNELYELKSPDVMSCVGNILKLYGVKMIAGELILEFANENKFIEKFNNFVMCITQLANMFVFFDKPE